MFSESPRLRDKEEVINLLKQSYSRVLGEFQEIESDVPKEYEKSLDLLFVLTLTRNVLINCYSA